MYNLLIDDLLISLQLISVRFNSQFYIEESFGEEACSYDYLTVYDMQNGLPVMVWVSCFI